MYYFYYNSELIFPIMVFLYYIYPINIYSTKIKVIIIEIIINYALLEKRFL